ncbi:MAG: helix-turn-helix domain-containing protein [Microbacteriaceae bacterium]|nr:helix-turn-helix domain-containing protein [Microbacteriaceae bacterium]
MDAVAAIAALDDPVRAAIYDLVASHDGAIGRDQVAHELELPRSTAAFQLDRLAASGLVEVEYRKPEGRGGPGSGRPAKLYRVAGGEVAVSVPERHYDLMGDVLASAIEASAVSGEPVLATLRTAASEAGRAAGREREDFDAVLEAAGYRPAATRAGTVMTNCPFHRLAAGHADVVCAASHAFVCGAAEATGRDADEVLLEPGAGRCCIRIVGPTSSQESSSGQSDT